MKRDYRVYLDDIIEAIGKIEEYSKGLSFDRFSEDRKVVDATVRNFEIIGEATKHMPQKIRSKYPDIPWRAMAGMRDKLIHEYFGINVQALWKTIKEDLPMVKSLIAEVLRKMNEEMEGGTGKAGKLF